MAVAPRGAAWELRTYSPILLGGPCDFGLLKSFVNSKADRLQVGVMSDAEAQHEY